jgi:single-strand DNA-binding protein
MNNVILIGRLTKDPELRYMQSDNTAIAKFTLAVDRAKKDETDFIRITVFGKQAENCDKYLKKGRQAAVQGRLQTGSYTKDGHTVYTTDVIASRVEFLGGKQDTMFDPDDIPSTDPAMGMVSPDSMAFAAVYDDIPF